MREVGSGVCSGGGGGGGFPVNLNCALLAVPYWKLTFLIVLTLKPVGKPLRVNTTEFLTSGLLLEPPPIPVHIVYPAGAHLPQRTRLFIDQAGAVLRGRFQRGDAER